MRYKILDAVHGFIRFNKKEKELIDSAPFQRLRYIHQMGCAYLIYPGATHSRFEHSLGVMELATRIYDSCMSTYNLTPEEKNSYRQSVRLAALVHDLGHLPFSHTAEKALLPGGGHERMTLAIAQSEPLCSILGDSLEDVLKIAVSEKELKELNSNLTLTPFERVLSKIITEDNFGADRVDYLIRDATYTGVGYGHFDYHQLIDTLTLLKNGNGELALGVTESGIQSVESLWIARYMMYARVYHLPKARVLAKHLARFMASYYEKVGFPATLETYLEETDYTLLTHLAQEAKKGDLDALCLLKKAPPYKEIFLPSEANLKALLEAFPKDVFIDNIEEKKAKRLFPVLLPHGEVADSTVISPFLHDIPLGGKPLVLFVNPKKEQEVKKWLETQCSH